jgi:hypothetical protein
MSYFQKYLKYKNKYLELKNQIGGDQFKVGDRVVYTVGSADMINNLDSFKRTLTRKGTVIKINDKDEKGFNMYTVELDIGQTIIGNQNRFKSIEKFNNMYHKARVYFKALEIYTKRPITSDDEFLEWQITQPKNKNNEYDKIDTIKWYMDEPEYPKIYVISEEIKKQAEIEINKEEEKEKKRIEEDIHKNPSHGNLILTSKALDIAKESATLASIAANKLVDAAIDAKKKAEKAVEDRAAAKRTI